MLYSYVMVTYQLEEVERRYRSRSGPGPRRRRTRPERSSRPSLRSRIRFKRTEQAVAPPLDQGPDHGLEPAAATTFSS
jgi:hypothetical protein